MCWSCLFVFSHLLPLVKSILLSVIVCFPKAVTDLDHMLTKSCRMNPCTLGWYLPLLVKDVPGALQPSEDSGERKGRKGDGEQRWQELDSKFRRDLPDEGYIGRLAYRGLMMRGCGRLRLLDGVGVSEKERKKAEELLEGILGRRGR